MGVLSARGVHPAGVYDQAMADSALLAAGGDDAPLTYVVPGATSIRIKQVHVAYVDNGAAGDWLPAVRIVSDSNHTMGVAADQGVKVTAGSDAGVSFFPGVKHAGSAGFFLNQAYLAQSNHGGQVIPSGFTTAINFTLFTSAPGWNPGPFGVPFPGPANPLIFTDNANIVFELQVTWPVGGYQRQVTMEIAHPPDTNNTYSPTIFGNSSPDDDQMILVAVVSGSAGVTPTTVTANVTHTRGVDATITAEWTAYSINGKIFPL